MTDDDETTVPGPCNSCGRDPAVGSASVWTISGLVWFCHDPDDDDPTCYETRGVT